MNEAIYTHLHIALQYSVSASGVLCTRQTGTLQLPTDRQHPVLQGHNPYRDFFSECERPARARAQKKGYHHGAADFAIFPSAFASLTGLQGPCTSPCLPIGHHSQGTIGISGLGKDSFVVLPRKGKHGYSRSVGKTLLLARQLSTCLIGTSTLSAWWMVAN